VRFTIATVQRYWSGTLQAVHFKSPIASNHAGRDNMGELELLEEVSSNHSLQRMVRWTALSNKASPYHDPTHRGEGAEKFSIMTRFYVGLSTRYTDAADLVFIAININGLAVYFSGTLRDPIESLFRHSLSCFSC
jgi:hypothetical protein